MKLNSGFLIICLILISSSVNAVNIMPAKITVDFEPNLKGQARFFICGADSLRPYIKGELVEYATIIDENPDGGCRDIIVEWNLPEKLEKPGKNVLWVGSLELLPGSRGGAVATRTAIEAPIVFFVPYPGLYVESTFIAPNVNLGEVVEFTVNVNNLGTDDIQSAIATIDVYDDYSKLKSLSTNREAIATKASAMLYVDMSTTGMKAGAYKAVATLIYDGEILKLEKIFNIGSLYVQINNYTKELKQEKINKFDIDIESRWNNLIEEVHGEVLIEDITAKTPTTELAPWQKKKITAYIDTAGMKLGEYDATITLFYDGKTTTETGKVYITEEIVVEEVEIKEEQPLSINFNITPTTILIAIIVLLVLVDIVWLIIRKKGKK